MKKGVVRERDSEREFRRESFGGRVSERESSEERVSEGEFRREWGKVHLGGSGDE